MIKSGNFRRVLSFILSVLMLFACLNIDVKEARAEEDDLYKRIYSLNDSQKIVTLSLFFSSIAIWKGADLWNGSESKKDMEKLATYMSYELDSIYYDDVSLWQILNSYQIDIEYLTKQIDANKKYRKAIKEIVTMANTFDESKINDVFGESYRLKPATKFTGRTIAVLVNLMYKFSEPIIYEENQKFTMNYEVVSGLNFIRGSIIKDGAYNISYDDSVSNLCDILNKLDYETIKDDLRFLFDYNLIKVGENLPVIDSSDEPTELPTLMPRPQFSKYIKAVKKELGKKKIKYENVKLNIKKLDKEIDRFSTSDSNLLSGTKSEIKVLSAINKRYSSISKSKRKKLESSNCILLNRLRRIVYFSLDINSFISEYLGLIKASKNIIKKNSRFRKNLYKIYRDLMRKSSEVLVDVTKKDGYNFLSLGVNKVNIMLTSIDNSKYVYDKVMNEYKKAKISRKYIYGDLKKHIGYHIFVLNNNDNKLRVRISSSLINLIDLKPNLEFCILNNYFKYCTKAENYLDTNNNNVGISVYPKKGKISLTNIKNQDCVFHLNKERLPIPNDKISLSINGKKKRVSITNDSILKEKIIEVKK